MTDKERIDYIISHPIDDWPDVLKDWLTTPDDPHAFIQTCEIGMQKILLLRSYAARTLIASESHEEAAQRANAVVETLRQMLGYPEPSGGFVKFSPSPQHQQTGHQSEQTEGSGA